MTAGGSKLGGVPFDRLFFPQCEGGVSYLSLVESHRWLGILWNSKLDFVGDMWSKLCGFIECECIATRRGIADL